MSFNWNDIAGLYAAERHLLKRQLIRKGLSAQSAADAVQEAFVRLLRSPPTDVVDARGYLRRTAENIAIDLHRKEARAARVIDPRAELDEQTADQTPLAETTMISREELARLEEALQELPPRSRQVLILHRYEGQSYAQIAENLGISKNTVMVHMVKALATLKASFDKKSKGSD